MLTVTQLARRLGVSRATVLYYEQRGLLSPSRRSANGYRWYGPEAEKRLKRILAYRSFGLPVAKLADLLERDDSALQEQILRDQFDALEQEISRLRGQQRAIIELLEQPELREQKMVNKERWVEIMRAAGLSDEDMINWHRQFEKMEPEEHQKFLESLSIEAEEIKQIRSL